MDSMLWTVRHSSTLCSDSWTIRHSMLWTVRHSSTQCSGQLDNETFIDCMLWTVRHSSTLCSDSWTVRLHWLNAPDSVPFMESMPDSWTVRHSGTLCSGPWDIYRLYALDSKRYKDSMPQTLRHFGTVLWTVMRHCSICAIGDEIFQDIRLVKRCKIASFRKQLRHWLRLRCCVDTLCYIGFIGWEGLETFGT